MSTSLNKEEKRAAIAMLSEYARRMDRLLQRLDAKVDTQLVADEYRQLKTDLKEHCRCLQKKESRGKVNHFESAYVLPAMLQASVSLRPATNSNPYRSHWFDAVCSAKDEIDYFLLQLKN